MPRKKITGGYAGELPVKTASVCPECLKIIGATIFEEKGKVWIKKTCDEHGEFRDLYWGSAEMYNKAKSFAYDGEGLENPNISKDNPVCPRDCGLCSLHKSHTALANLVVTNRCDLSCWYCFYYAKKAGYVYEPTMEELRKSVKLMTRERPVPGNAVQLTGGNPELRDDIIEIINMIKEEGVDHIQLNINGTHRFWKDPKWVKKIRESGVNTLYLSFDGVTPKTNPKNHWEIPYMFENARKAGKVGIVLVPTVINSVNDHEVGDIIRFGFKNMDIVRGVNLQPVSLVGRMPRKEREKFRITIPDVIARIEEQTDGEIGKEDFYPVPSMGAITNFVESLVKKPQYSLSTHFACIPGTEKIVIYNDNEPHIKTFPDLIDRIIKNGKTDFVEIGDVKVCDISHLDYKIPTIGNKLIRINKIMKRPGKKIYKITTESGREIRLTNDHRIFVYEHDKIKHKRVKDLSLKDKLICSNTLPEGQHIKELVITNHMRNAPPEILRTIYVRGWKDKLKLKKDKGWKDFFKEFGFKCKNRTFYAWLERNTIPFDVFMKLKEKYEIDDKNLRIGTEVSKKELPIILKITPELMRIVGYYISEGHYELKTGKKSSYRIGFSNSNSEIIKDIEYCLKKLNWKYSINISHGRPQIFVNGKIHAVLFKYVLGLKPKAPTKNLPPFVLSLPKNLLINLLIGLVSGDGWIKEAKGKNSIRVGYTTSSRELILDLVHLLLKFGIKPRIWFKSSAGTKTRIEGRPILRKNNQWMIVVSRWDNVEKLILNGFKFIDKKRNKTLETVKPKRSFTYPENVYDIEKVKEIIPLNVNEKYVYDIEVEEPHGFLCNGILVHNCGMATYVFQEEGKMIPITRFVDIEGLFEYLNEKAEELSSGKSKYVVGGKMLFKLNSFIDKKKSPKDFSLSKIIYNALMKHDYRALGAFHHRSMFIGMMHFMDLWNYDINRVKRCCIHYLTPEAIIPFCTFNVIPEMYRDRFQEKYSVPIKKWEKKTGRSLDKELYRRDIKSLASSELYRKTYEGFVK